ncbi:MAG: DMT family transporter [Rhodovibrionaceae bacterium]
MSAKPGPALPVTPAAAATTGVIVVLLAASSLAPLTTFARLAYDSGATPTAVLLARYACASLALLVLLLVLRRPLLPPRWATANVLGAAFSWFIASNCYLAAVNFIPVSLAALIFYTFPLMVAVLARFTEGARIGRLGQLAFLAAFAGLALALGPSFQGLDWRGIVFALAGAAGSAGALLFTGRLGTRIDGFGLTFWTNAFSLPGMIVLILLTGSWALPSLPEGWLPFAGGAVCYVVAINLMFLGTRLAGAAKSSMILNLEPVITIGVAAALLGERLTPLQFVGAALVVAAVALTSFKRRRKLVEG